MQRKKHVHEVKLHELKPKINQTQNPNS